MTPEHQPRYRPSTVGIIWVVAGSAAAIILSVTGPRLAALLALVALPIGVLVIRARS